jgi:branched-chain amino acid transport system substrate-binding protein
MRAMRLGATACGLLCAGAGVLGGCGGSNDNSSSDTGSTAAKSGKPIVIGAAIDKSALMAPTDDPALYGGQIEAAKINAQGGVNGRKIVFKVENTQLKPAQTRADALKLVTKDKADVLWVTCDVDFSTPSITVGLTSKKLTVAPCIGTDQMGPKRFGAAGKLAFSFGNVAQDEGAADAQIAKRNGWKTANVVIDKQIVYSQNVCAAFAAKFKQLGGKVVNTQTWTQGDKTIQSVASKTNASKADVIMMCTTAAPDVSTFVSAVRSLGNQTPMLAPWSLDGTYWLPKNPKLATNIWTDSYASIYGDDPNPDVKALIGKLTAQGHPPTTGGFVTGAAAVDAIAAAYKKAGANADGTKLAAAMEKFQGLKTISGDVSFSPELHTVFGREYRILKVTNRKGKFVGTIKAGGLAKIG